MFLVQYLSCLPLSFMMMFHTPFTVRVTSIALCSVYVQCMHLYIYLIHIHMHTHIHIHTAMHMLRYIMPTYFVPFFTCKWMKKYIIVIVLWQLLLLHLQTLTDANSLTIQVWCGLYHCDSTAFLTHVYSLQRLYSNAWSRRKVVGIEEHDWQGSNKASVHPTSI